MSYLDDVREKLQTTRSIPNGGLKLLWWLMVVGFSVVGVFGMKYFAMEVRGHPDPTLGIGKVFIFVFGMIILTALACILLWEVFVKGIPSLFRKVSSFISNYIRRNVIGYSMHIEWKPGNEPRASIFCHSDYKHVPANTGSCSIDLPLGGWGREGGFWSEYTGYDWPTKIQRWTDNGCFISVSLWDWSLGRYQTVVLPPEVFLHILHRLSGGLRSTQGFSWGIIVEEMLKELETNDPVLEDHRQMCAAMKGETPADAMIATALTTLDEIRDTRRFIHSIDGRRVRHSLAERLLALLPADHGAREACEKHLRETADIQPTSVAAQPV